MNNTPVFCDRLQVTMDRMAWRTMRSSLLPLLDSMGCTAKVDDPGAESGYWVEPEGGSFSAKPKGRVVAIGASGRGLAKLRACGMLGEFLRRLSGEPHRVTVVDVTMDVERDAPAVLAQLYRTAIAGGLRLTRKSLRARDVLRIMSPRELDGVETGTVYLGSRQAEVRMRVYDKQAERLFHGVDRGPGVRYEVTVRNGLPSLRDVYVPAPLFWHHAQNVLERPVGVAEWVVGSMGLELPRVEQGDALDLLRRKIQWSPDIRRMVELADSLPNGRARLLGELCSVFPQSLASARDSEGVERPSLCHP